MFKSSMATFQRLFAFESLKLNQMEQIPYVPGNYCFHFVGHFVKSAILNISFVFSFALANNGDAIPYHTTTSNGSHELTTRTPQFIYIQYPFCNI